MPKSRPMSHSASPQPREQPLGHLGRRRGGEVEVVVGAAEHRVAHRPADQVQLVAGVGEQRARGRRCTGASRSSSAPTRRCTSTIESGSGVGHGHPRDSRSRPGSTGEADTLVPVAESPTIPARPRGDGDRSGPAALASARRTRRRRPPTRRRPDASTTPRPALDDAPLGVTIDRLAPGRPRAPATSRSPAWSPTAPTRSGATSTSTPSPATRSTAPPSSRCATRASWPRRMQTPSDEVVGDRIVDAGTSDADRRARAGRARPATPSPSPPSPSR